MAKQHAFNVGDIVRLKSGGPNMTVQTLPDAGGRLFTCQWFAGKKLENGRFPAESLEVAPVGAPVGA
ncbi:YodC family protein [Pseudomonas sp. NY15437]|uniref:YodC family protein n=1 Tax=Pseudomonas sp. NY15437 TaxID=3400360 RepID=UPI003A83925C